MKRALFAVFVVMIALPAAAADRRSTVNSEAEAMRSRLVECRREFHMYPELSNREVETARRITDRLRQLGIPFESGIARNGIIATIKGAKPGKTIIARADIDALPVTETIDVPYKSKNAGVKHACGHDAHLTVALFTAELLWKHRNELRGTAHVLFQPAEEGPPPGEEGGAELMIKEGVLDRLKPDAMFALHVEPQMPVGKIGWTPGAHWASSDRFTLTITGKGTHGAFPHLGIDPIVVGAEIVSALQTIASRRIDPIEPVVVTIGQFHAGTRNNIIPDKAELEGTVRSLSASVREKTKALVKETAEGIAKAAGATAVVEFSQGNPPTVNDERVGTFGEQSIGKTIGAANVVRIRPVMGAEDFAYFAEKVPSLYFRLGVANAEKGINSPLHSATFDIDEEALVVGTKAMTNMIMDYLQ